MHKVLILNYHRISHDSVLDSKYAIHQKTFEEQLIVIKHLGIPVIGLNQIHNLPIKDDFSIALTFDDGNESDYFVALSLLEQYKFPATFFPIVENVGNENYLTWQQLQNISTKGFEIGSHGLSHKPLTKLSNQESKKELRDSKAILEQKLNVEIKHFAAPFGRFSNNLLSCSKSVGYSTFYSTGRTFNKMTDIDKVLYRWNVTNDLSVKQFETLLLLRGKSTIRMNLSFYLKQLAKKMFVPRVLNNSNKVTSNG